MIGDRIGVYHVHSLLGSGGMGEVYRARDTTLGRDVAIKVLPASLTVDADRLARFEREARVLASLNHPHIAAIYGVEADAAATGSIRALVLELVEGETLADRIAQGPLSVDEALALARQIASALDAAHEKGIVHRDLKPANIKITPDGTVKVLDFGIAKAVDDGVASPVGGAAITAFASRALTVLGTAAYMSPEQARGSRVDKRADIWAFGCVLYEMLTGRGAFAAETVTDTLARVVEREPDWSALPRDVPRVVRELLRRCIEKDPRKRLRDIGDASFEEDTAAPPAAPGARRSRGASIAWLAGGVLLAAASFAAWEALPLTRAEQRVDVTTRRFTDFVGMEEEPALSPDGKTVAFVARTDGHRHIWLRLLAGGPPLQVTRDAMDHHEPRWSPDSSSIIYFTSSESARGGTLWEISALGGDSRRLTAAASGGDVSPDGRALALVRFSDDGVELATLSRDGSRTLDAHTLGPEGVFSSVRWSPDGRWLAVQRLDEAFNQLVLVVPSNGGEPFVIARSTRILGYSWLADSSGIVYSSATGSTILYPPTSNLRTVSRDGTGDRPLTFGDVSYTQPDIRGTGDLVATRTQIQSDLWRFPLGGSPQENARAAVRITRQTGQVQTVSVSPDGTQVAYLSDSGGHGNIWVSNVDGSGTRQVTFEQSPDVSIGVPIWSSSSDDITYIVSRSGGANGLWLVKSDGSSPRELVPRGIGASWSGDDRWLYYGTTIDEKSCIMKIPLPAATPPTTVRCDDASSAAIAPDGSALYFMRFPTGVLEAEINKASPENAPPTVLARVALDRVPHHPRQLVPTVSPDGSALVMSLVDGQTTNLWVQPTNGDAMYPVTDFGDRAVLIARRVAWAPDGRSLYAAVADVDSDIVLLGGLLH